jgi:hypothetical protein
MNLSNLKINPTRTVAIANAINARETSTSVRKIHLWFDIFIQDGYRYYNITVSINDNLNKILYREPVKFSIACLDRTLIIFNLWVNDYFTI